MPPKIANQQLVSPSQQYSITLVSFGQEFLSIEYCDNTGASPVLSNLAPTDFYLFPQLKSDLKGQHFCDATDIIKHSMTSRYVSVTFIVTGRSVWLHKGLSFKEM
jgi:hypothetical protein